MKPLICTVFSMFNAVVARIDYFRIFIIETKLDFFSFIEEHFQRWRKFVAERHFPILNS